MSTRWYCPSCRKELPSGAATAECPLCRADFGENAAWGPVQNDQGSWSPRLTSGDDYPSLAYALFQVLWRLILGAFAWLALGALVMVSAIPYGGGSKGLIILLQLATVCIPIWAAIPLARVLYELVSKKAEQ